MKDKFFEQMCWDSTNYHHTIKYLRKNHSRFEGMSKKQGKEASSVFVNNVMRTLVFDPDFADETYYKEDGLVVHRVPRTSKLMLAVMMQEENHASE